MTIENTQSAPEAGSEATPVDDDWMASAEALYDELSGEQGDKTPLAAPLKPTEKEAESPEEPVETPPEGEEKTEQTEQEAGADDAAAEKDTGQPNEDGSEPETAIAPPNSWPAEMKAKWGEVPPDVQQIIAQRDTESHQQISRMGQEIAQFKPIGELLGDKQDVFDRHGLSVQDGLKTLLEAQEKLDADPVNALTAIANSFGIDLASTFGSLNTEQLSDQNAAQTIQQLQQQNAQLASERNQLNQRLAQQQNRQTVQQEREAQARKAEAAQTVQKWASDPKSPKPYFEQVRGTMATLMSSNPSANLDELYEQACYATPEIRTKMQADAEAKKAAENRTVKAREVNDAKKAKVVNAGTAKPAMPARGGSWDDDKALSERFDAIASNAG